MSDADGNPGHQIERLNALSKNVSDAINELFSMAYAQAHEMSWLPPSGSDPDIKLIEKSLWINRVMIPLASRQKTLNLIRAFFTCNTLELSKLQIAEAVYGPQHNHSQRFIEAQDGSLTKLLSRTRSFLEESLAHAHQERPLDWLVFDVKTRRYRLYKVRSEFLKRS